MDIPLTRTGLAMAGFLNPSDILNIFSISLAGTMRAWAERWTLAVPPYNTCAPWPTIKNDFLAYLVVDSMWAFTTEIWKHRSSVLHGDSDKPRQKSFQRIQVNQFYEKIHPFFFKQRHALRSFYLLLMSVEEAIQVCAYSEFVELAHAYYFET